MDRLPEDWRQLLEDGYGQGAGDEQFCVQCGITRKEFQTLFENYEVFREAIEFGRDCRIAWYLEQGRKALNDKSFNFQGWYMQMKNLFGWSDKQVNVNQSDLDGKTEDQVNAQVIKALEDYFKANKNRARPNK